MSKFFVGQRVKKVRGRDAIGMTGTVSEIGGFGEYSVRVRMDGDAVGTKGGRPALVPAGRPGWCRACDLEPIQPDGAQPSEFTTLHDLLDSLEGIAA